MGLQWRRVDGLLNFAKGLVWGMLDKSVDFEEDNDDGTVASCMELTVTSHYSYCWRRWLFHVFALYLITSTKHQQEFSSVQGKKMESYFVPPRFPTHLVLCSFSWRCNSSVAYNLCSHPLTQFPHDFENAWGSDWVGGGERGEVICREVSSKEVKAEVCQRGVLCQKEWKRGGFRQQSLSEQGARVGELWRSKDPCVFLGLVCVVTVGPLFFRVYNI